MPSHEPNSPRSTAGSSVAKSLRVFDAFVAAGGAPLLATGCWGLEREVLRVEADGQPARTPHPFPPDEKRITVDFAENQVEFVTGTHVSPEGALDELGGLQRRLVAVMGDELLWPLSLPGRWDDPDRVQAASFCGRPEWEDQRAYRRELEQRHGKARQVICGLHYNFSFPAEFFACWRLAVNSSGGEKSLRDATYFAVMRNFFRYQHVFSALWGVSPPGDEAFWGDLLAHARPELQTDAVRCRERISSVRLSPLGYALAADVEKEIGVTFASLAEYRTRLTAAIQPPPGGKAMLAHEREFYSAVRPKPTASAAEGHAAAATSRREPLALLDALERDGVGYLEFRVFDLDPFEPLGVGPEELRFFHVFVLTCLFLPSPLISAVERTAIAERNRWATLCGSPLRLARGGGDAKDAGGVRTLFDAMETIAARLPPSYALAVARAREMWDGVRPRPIDRLRDALQADSQTLLELGLTLARRHREVIADGR